MCRRGTTSRQIARELGMSVSTVAQIISANVFSIPKARTPSKTQATSINKKAIADYSRAKVTRIALPPAHESKVCNSMMRGRYVPTELSYRGQR